MRILTLLAGNPHSLNLYLLDATVLDGRLELYKVAATAFLALGVGAVIESSLVPSSNEAVMSHRGRSWWSLVDIYVIAITIVTIAAGEALCVRVLTAQAGTAQDELISRSKGEIKILLWIAAGSIVGQALGRRALANAWKKEGTDPTKLDNRRLLKATLAAVTGTAFGLGVLLNLAVLGRNPKFFKTGLSSAELFSMGLLLVGIIGFVALAAWQRCEN